MGDKPETKPPPLTWEVHSKREGLEGVFYTQAEALAYAATLVGAFGEPLASFEVRPAR